MTPPYHEPGADAAFWALFGLFLVGEYASRIRSRRHGRGSPVERRSLVVVVATVVGAVAAAFRLATWHAVEFGAGAWPVFALGLALMAAGIGIRQWAILTLGRFFTVEVRVQPDHTVVEGGPYRWVRHPAYTGLLVFFVGLGLALTNWASLLVLAIVPAAGLLFRIRVEERALLAGLGERYRSYAATRRRLFPGIW